MKIYKGNPLEIDANGGEIVRIYEDGNEWVLNPAPSQKLFNHSPCGFNHGYCGSGPAQLALALLLDATGDSGNALRYHQSFKSEVVSSWPTQEAWKYTEDQIKSWLCIAINKGGKL